MIYEQVCDLVSDGSEGSLLLADDIICERASHKLTEKDDIIDLLKSALVRYDVNLKTLKVERGPSSFIRDEKVLVALYKFMLQEAV